MALLSNSTFVNGIGGWRPVNIAASVTANVVADNSAHSGGTLLRASTTQGGGSVAYDANVLRSIDVRVIDSAGHSLGASGTVIDPSVGVLAWVRATPGSGQTSGTLALWQLPQPNKNTSTNFTVSEQWTNIGLSYDLRQGGAIIRVEFYLGSPGHSLDIDSVSLF